MIDFCKLENPIKDCFTWNDLLTLCDHLPQAREHDRRQLRLKSPPVVCDNSPQARERCRRYPRLKLSSFVATIFQRKLPKISACRSLKSRLNFTSAMPVRRRFCCLEPVHRCFCCDDNPLFFGSSCQHNSCLMYDNPIYGKLSMLRNNPSMEMLPRWSDNPYLGKFAKIQFWEKVANAS